MNATDNRLNKVFFARSNPALQLGQFDILMTGREPPARTAGKGVKGLEMAIEDHPEWPVMAFEPPLSGWRAAATGLSTNRHRSLWLV
jgi:hypothetical protein